MTTRDYVNVYNGRDVVRADGTRVRLDQPLVCQCGVIHRMLELRPLSPKYHEPDATHRSTCPYDGVDFTVKCDA